MILSLRERSFLLRQRIGHLATADSTAVPSVVPVCFAIGKDCLYTALDQKPKATRSLRRIRNIGENPQVAFVADCYDEDWSKLGWVMVRGQADVFDSGETFRHGRELLRERYSQYAEMTLSPVIAIRIVRVRSWGNLDG